MEYVTHCNSLIKQRSDETDEATLMLSQVQGQGECTGGRNARYNAQNRGPTYNRGRPQYRDQRREVCHACGQPGHWAKECWNRRNGRTYSTYGPVEERRGVQYRDGDPYYRQQDRWGTQLDSAG